VFLRAHPDPVLLVQGMEQGSDEVSSDRTVRLGDMSSGQIRSITAAYAISVKKQRSLGADKILVGRGRENDVVLPFKSVSRLHAFFRLGNDGLWTVEDAGSAYGTYVRETRLTSGNVRALGDDTPVRFGGVDASFHTAPGLYDFLGKLVKVTPRP
jgi:pSer/pThr/pTyr-binding forkhead associated (FHA) protein